MLDIHVHLNVTSLVGFGKTNGTLERGHLETLVLNVSVQGPFGFVAPAALGAGKRVPTYNQ